jgi:hypothetical protein
VKEKNGGGAAPHVTRGPAPALAKD